MSTTPAPGIDTREMVAVHDALDDALKDALTKLAAVEASDASNADRLASFLDEVLWFLHAHHAGEDELLYPLIIERAPQSRDLCARMDEQHRAVASAHEQVEESLARFRSTESPARAVELAAALEALRGTLSEHVDDEEDRILPVAAQVISMPEWGALPAHAMSSYRGERMWLVLGLVLEAMPDDVRTQMEAHLPPPVSAMWQSEGANAYAAEMNWLRS